MRKVFFIGRWADYEDIFFNICIDGNSISTLNTQKINFFWMNVNKFGGRIKEFIIKKVILKKIVAEPDAVFFFQDNAMIIKIILSLNDKKDFRIIFRNTVSSDSRMEGYLPKLIKNKIKIYSFDKNDCERYGFIHYDNFIKLIPSIGKDEIIYDATFIGRDKGRYCLLQKIKKDMESLGLLVKIEVLNKDYSKKIPYTEYLKNIIISRAIIDIVHDGQIGLTLRPLESIFYKKKLITNNTDIVNYDFYNVNNIYILDDCFDSEKFYKFMHSPYVEIQEQILKKYSAERVIFGLINNGV